MSIVTRGFGESGGLITRGHGVVIQAIEVLATYTSQVARKYSDDIFKLAEEVIDVYKITASLISINGEYLPFPESKIAQGSINRSKDIAVSVNNFAVSNVYKPAYKIVIDVLGVKKGIK
tara:strand:+ start:63 stop:419 length:357 start_codon:yes stop_codon:yes gene_type:complete